MEKVIVSPMHDPFPPEWGDPPQDRGLRESWVASHAGQGARALHAGPEVERAFGGRPFSLFPKRWGHVPYDPEERVAWIAKHVSTTEVQHRAGRRGISLESVKFWLDLRRLESAEIIRERLAELEAS